ncbi:hypothetical protein EXIGLDRAFT_777894 [Exidia glandulosa HHB12029]|uniref:Uncharacterized protein n=1 Tax=Exidia glandulosa HHB12029 TaxID=1314781 RepID=A0A165ZIZ4_EXIGL|nr:hypothetical protein EXIGLDRAFT_777894 [Exidia glandulosa HHB12029]
MVIYRDGAGEGQYANVSDEETSHNAEALAAVKYRSKEADAPPRTSFIGTAVEERTNSAMDQPMTSNETPSGDVLFSAERRTFKLRVQ